MVSIRITIRECIQIDEGMSRMKVLVTGARGQLGYDVVERLGMLNFR